MCNNLQGFQQASLISDFEINFLAKSTRFQQVSDPQSGIIFLGWADSIKKPRVLAIPEMQSPLCTFYSMYFKANNITNAYNIHPL